MNNLTREEILEMFEDGKKKWLEALLNADFDDIVNEDESAEMNAEYDGMWDEFREALIDAIRDGNHRFVCWLLHAVRRLFIDVALDSCALPATYAASIGDVTTLALIVLHGPNGACWDLDDSPSAIHAAVAHGHPDCVALLRSHRHEIPFPFDLGYRFYDTVSGEVETEWEAGTPIEYCKFRSQEVAEKDPELAARYEKIADLLGLSLVTLGLNRQRQCGAQKP